MAQKPSNQAKAEQNSVAANISVGGNVGGNLIVGSGNTINLPSPHQISLRSLHQLPQPPADFTGREQLIEELLKDFESHKGATISGLTGMGGIGKTVLGLVIANQLKDKYPDAQIFLDLKGTTEPLSAMDIARYVILSFEPTADLRALDDANMFATYQSLLHGKKVLLFLDNARSAEPIAPLHPPDSCAMLVTSRWTFSLPGLQTRRVDVMSKNDAESFLFELCFRIKDKATELASVCAYLPLALRIAGCFLQVNNDWSIEKYLSQLNDRKKRLVTLKESRIEAELKSEPDLLATFELSYNQLSDEDKKRWRMLGVFPASFDAIAVSVLWELEEDKATKSLNLLRRYSLLEYDETSTRYNLHDLLTDYALAQMGDDEEQDSRAKHASHYLKIMSLADTLYLEGGNKILQGLHLFDLEWEHILAGQAWVAKNHALSPDIARVCGGYTGTSFCLDLRLHPRELISWHKAALLADRFLGDRQGESSDLTNLGRTYMHLGEMQKAIEFYEQALVIDREIGDRHTEGLVLGNLGVVYRNLGEFHKAIELTEQALAIARDVGDLRSEGNWLGNLGVTYRNLGEVHKAIQIHEQQLIIVQKIGDRRGEGNTLGNLGLAYRNLGEMQKAIEFYEKALLLMREIGDKRAEAIELGNLGVAYYGLNDKAKAVRLMKQTLAIFESIESPNAEKARNILNRWGALE